MSTETLHSKLWWLLAGAVAGALMAKPVEMSVAKTWNAYCGTDELMARAKALRKAGVVAGDHDKHRAANVAYAAAHRCGSANALAEIGTSICIGLGEAKDRGKGLSLLREAADQGSSLAIERLTKLELYCPFTK